MYDYYRARRPRGRDRHNHEMLLYTGDDSDGSGGSRKRWSNKKKSLRNNPRDSRECYGCGKKGHIKRDCRSTGNKKAGFARRTGKCSYCDKSGQPSIVQPKSPHTFSPTPCTVGLSAIPSLGHTTFGPLLRPTQP